MHNWLTLFKRGNYSWTVAIPRIDDKSDNVHQIGDLVFGRYWDIISQTTTFAAASHVLLLHAPGIKLDSLQTSFLSSILHSCLLSKILSAYSISTDPLGKYRTDSKSLEAFSLSLKMKQSGLINHGFSSWLTTVLNKLVWVKFALSWLGRQVELYCNDLTIKWGSCWSTDGRHPVRPLPASVANTDSFSTSN